MNDNVGERSGGEAGKMKDRLWEMRWMGGLINGGLWEGGMKGRRRGESYGEREGRVAKENHAAANRTQLDPFLLFLPSMSAWGVLLSLARKK